MTGCHDRRTPERDLLSTIKWCKFGHVPGTINTLLKAVRSTLEGGRSPSGQRKKMSSEHEGVDWVSCAGPARHHPSGSCWCIHVFHIVWVSLSLVPTHNLSLSHFYQCYQTSFTWKHEGFCTELHALETGARRLFVLGLRSCMSSTLLHQTFCLVSR